MVTDVPTAPEVGERLVMTGAGNQTPLLATPPTVTTTLPSDAPVGSVATIDVLLQDRKSVGRERKLTVLVPCVAPKLLPLMVTTVVPGVPVVGERLVITGAEALTVKLTP